MQYSFTLISHSSETNITSILMLGSVNQAPVWQAYRVCPQHPDVAHLWCNVRLIPKNSYDDRIQCFTSNDGPYKHCSLSGEGRNVCCLACIVWQIVDRIELINYVDQLPSNVSQTSDCSIPTRTRALLPLVTLIAIWWIWWMKWVFVGIANEAYLLTVERLKPYVKSFDYYQKIWLLMYTDEKLFILRWFFARYLAKSVVTRSFPLLSVWPKKCHVHNNGSLF